MISKKMIDVALSDNRAGYPKGHDFFSGTRDVFNARLQVYITETEKWLESAVIGEIGNNTFDHNFQFLPEFPRGVYFDSCFFGEFVILADFGRGITNSLKRVRPEITSDIESVTMAFTQRISGRYPEQRGNGLKFVLETIHQNNWSLFFQSGNGCCNADGSGISFCESRIVLPGCLAILRF